MSKATTIEHSIESVLKPPPNVNIPIWRYMDLTKYVSMLGSKSLFFVRADKIEDLFEGSTPRSNIAMRPAMYAGKSIPDIAFKKMGEVTQPARAWTYINPDFALELSLKT
jgi:hypothetical protein